jgi:hypothetical protein
MHRVSCPSCRRRGRARIEREFHGTEAGVIFTCLICRYSWKPRAATLKVFGDGNELRDDGNP